MTERSMSYARGRGAINHNNRVYLTPNVDKTRVNNNIVLEQQPIAEAYEKIFWNAQAEYNAKQKRKDRKIDDYFKHVFGCEPTNDVVKDSGKNPRHSFYEYCVGLGTMDDTGYATNPEAAKLAEQCLREFIKGNEELGIPSFAERNPNFYVFNAVIHCDEATPHLHYDFIPFADGYKQGMTRQQGIAKALEQMGYGKGKDAIKKFTEDERKIFRTICEAHGFEVATEKKGRGYTLTCDEYREFAAQIEGYKGQIEDLLSDIETQERKLATLDAKVENAQDDYAKISEQVQTEQAKLDTLHTAVDEAQKQLDKISLQIVLAVKIPPRPTEPTAPKPLPEKVDWKARNAHKAAMKSYEKALAAYPAELAEWEEKYLTIETIQKAQRQLTQDKQDAQPMLDKAEQLRQIQAALIQGQKQLAADKKKQEADAEALEQAKAAFIKGKDAIVAIEARKTAEQILVANGYRLGGYGVDEQMQQAQLQQQVQQHQKGGITR